MDDPSKRSLAFDNDYRFAELESRFQQQTLGVATSLVSLIDLRDRYTGGHSQRVAAYVRDIAVEMALPDNDAETIVFAASLHDVGKIGVPDHVLLKPSGLLEEEFVWIRKHPEWGWMALRNVSGFEPAALLVLHHHERLDGKGYPSRLKGDEIPLGSRLIAVADAYDALTTTRPYRNARTREDALSELYRCAGNQFDPAVVGALATCLRRQIVRIA
jgi:HD-GYP domain-containing protein (c-di-GMP phosphodiesterase class II)